MKTTRTTTILTAAVLGLGTSLPAQQADSTRTEGTDRSMPMMEQSGVAQDSGVARMTRMMDHCRAMMKTDSAGTSMDDMSGMQMGAGAEPDATASAGGGS